MSTETEAAGLLPVPSLCGVSPTYASDDFRDDGWVYRPDGSRRCKWFGWLPHTRHPERGRVRFWEAKLQLEYLPVLEAKRWKWEQRRRKYLATSWTRDGFEERLKAMLPCGGWRDNGRKAQGWVLLELARGSQGQEWISWSWQPDRFKDKPERIEQDMVDEFFRRYRADMWCNWRAALFQAAFCYAIDTNYAGREQFQGKRATATLHLVLNGRDYWFRRAETPSPWFFEALSLPEDTVTERFTVELPPASGWGIRD